MSEALPWYPPVGVFIGILGLLGVVVPLVRDLAKINKWEKALWTIIMFALMGLEMRSIYLDRKAHDIEQATARAEQLKHFKEIGAGITEAIDESQKEFTATMQRSDSILTGVGETIKIANGGDSYAFIQLGGTNPSEFEMQLMHHGRYHLLDVVGDVTDVDKFMAELHFGSRLHGLDRSKYVVNIAPVNILYRSRGKFVTSERVGVLPKATGTYMRYNISLSARNGDFSELLRVKIIDPYSWCPASVGNGESVRPLR